MKQFTKHTGKIVILDRENIDTDQIIPKQFLKSIKCTGFGKDLFFDWRYLDDGSPNPDFELNQEQNQGATILLTGNNFGCGSSREHAVWAVQQYGFQVVIAPKKGNGENFIPAFADIFRNNSLKNGLLTVELEEIELQKLKEKIISDSNQSVTIDLKKQVVSCAELAFSFEIDSAHKEKLIQGLDDIGMTLQEEQAIQAFEKRHDPQVA